MAYDLSAAHRYLFLHPKTGRAAVLASILALLGGCTTLGSESILIGRTPVNEAVATTSRQQTLMNIVRVYHNEAPVILDLVEADEAVSLGASGTGGVSAIGAIPGTMGRSGAAAATLSAADGITNRYVPLQGQALISQLSSQITVETLNALYDSDWPIQSILEFAVDRITPNNDDYDLAEDLITQLDANLSISLATAKSGFSKDTDSTSAKPIGKTGSWTINTQPPSSGGGDTMNIYLGPRPNGVHSKKNGDVSFNAWKRLYALYRQTQPDQKGIARNSSVTMSNVIELRNSPRTHIDKLKDADFATAILGPVMRTRTAVGILKYIVSQPDVAFLTEDEYRFVTHLDWNTQAYHRRCPQTDVYVLSPKQNIGWQDKDPEIINHISDTFKDNSNFEKINNFLEDTYNKKFDSNFDNGSYSCVYSYGVIGNNTYNAEFATDLGLLKRFILIVASKDPPQNAFTTWFDGGSYYSIMADDLISQRNLMLVSQFLTIQATSSPTPSLTTVSPSGR